MKLAIVGVTGMVGREILAVLAERNFPISELIPVASKKSCGKTISYLGKTHTIISLDDLLAKEVDLALFSAGSEISKIWAPKLATKGCKVIDNSSFWRINPFFNRNYWRIFKFFNYGEFQTTNLYHRSKN